MIYEDSWLALCAVAVCLMQKVLRQQRHGPARSAFCCAAVPGGAGDIKMCPMILLSEPRQITGRGNSARGAIADISHIREIAFQRVLVLVP